MLDELAPDEKSDAERELAPSVDVPDESDANPTLQRKFWLLVLVFNVALMAVSVGAMLAVFRGQYDTGTSLVAAGLVLSAYGFYKYRRYTNAADDADDGSGDNSDDNSGENLGDGSDDNSDDNSGENLGDGSGDNSGDATGSIADLDAHSRD